MATRWLGGIHRTGIQRLIQGRNYALDQSKNGGSASLCKAARIPCHSSQAPSSASTTCGRPQHRSCLAITPTMALPQQIATVSSDFPISLGLQGEVQSLPLASSASHPYRVLVEPLDQPRLLDLDRPCQALLLLTMPKGPSPGMQSSTTMPRSENARRATMDGRGSDHLLSNMWGKGKHWKQSVKSCANTTISRPGMY